MAAGDFAPFAAAMDSDQTIAGTASMTVSASGTQIELAVTGLTAGETYPVHVHALPCAVMDADGHYKIDPSVTDALEDNELWPTLTPDDSGEASSSFMNAHVARPDALAVVIHHAIAEPAPKIACADLVRKDYAPFETLGTLAALGAATDAGVEAITGTASMMRTLDGKTRANVTVGGLTPETEYPIHVHDRACEAMSGGGHYKLDPMVSEAVANNEIWLTLTTDATGAGNRNVMVDHVARAEAQAIVVHGADSMRLGCIDLSPK
jgi:hypothetical protein